MIICICRNVSEAKVRAAIDGGANTVEAVARACRAGSGCGACREQICEMISACPGCPRSLADCPEVPLAVLSPAA